MKQARCVAGKIKHHNCRLIFEMTRFGPILLERQSVEAPNRAPSYGKQGSLCSQRVAPPDIE
jgi:hypothetical protein